MITDKTLDAMIRKMQDWFVNDCGNCAGPAVIGISGGKDSSVVAAFLAKSIGKENVYGVLMPNGEQSDIGDSLKLCETIGIRFTMVNIRDAVNGIVNAIRPDYHEAFKPISDTTRFSTNIPPRIRMTVLYAVAQKYGGVVINTTNAAEAYVGYGTLFGDTCGDFAPIQNMFVDEVIELGRTLGLPEHFVVKPPADGLTGRTDEDVLGFTYADVKQVALGVEFKTVSPDVEREINRKHRGSEFKRSIIHLPSIDFYRHSNGEIVGVKL